MSGYADGSAGSRPLHPASSGTSPWAVPLGVSLAEAVRPADELKSSACLAAPRPASDGADVLPATAEEFFHAFLTRIYRVARRMLGNDADAEDVTQDVFLQVVRKLKTFRGEARVTTWLHRVTVNAALVHRRKQIRHREHQINVPLEVLGSVARACTASPSKAPIQQLLDNESHQLIKEAILRLPDIYRDAFVLADIEGLTSVQIGKLLGLRVPAVKSRLHRARLMMREMLIAHFS